MSAIPLQVSVMQSLFRKLIEQIVKHGALTIDFADGATQVFGDGSGEP